jgi:hypothetical protein
MTANSIWHFALLICLLLPASLTSVAQSVDSKPKDFKVGMAFRKFTPTGTYNWRSEKTHALLATV